MPDPIIDRDAIIEKAKIHIYNEVEDADWGNAHDAAAAVLPSITDDMLAPIEALHHRAHLIFNNRGGGFFPDEPCATCDGRAGVHECGCYGDYDLPIYCVECSDLSGRAHHVEWPCPTAQAVAAIREAVRA